MKKITIVFCLIAIFLLSVHPNEKESDSKNDFLKFNVIDNYIKYKTTMSNSKTNGMYALGGVGIGLVVAGFGTGFAGGFIAGYYFTVLPGLKEAVLNMGGAYPSSWDFIAWVGVGLAAGGGVLFLAGLAMTIAGFAMANYYKNHPGSARMEIKSLFDKDSFSYCISMKI